MDREASAVEGSMGRIHRLRALVVELHLLAAEFGRTNGLHPTDVRALICLLDAGRGGLAATPTWLGEQVHLNSASVTALIDRLEKAGHVRRTRDSRDRRRVLLEVTPDATRLGWAFFGPLISNAAAALDSYTPDELEVVDRFLADVSAGVEATRESRADQPPRR